MNKITCDMCIDLMPLVQDGVASEDSRSSIEEHTAHCPACKKLFNEMGTPPVQGPEDRTEQVLERVYRKQRRKTILSWAVIILALTLAVWAFLEVRFSGELIYAASTNEERILKEMPALALTDEELALAKTILDIPHIQDSISDDFQNSIVLNTEILIPYFAGILPENGRITEVFALGSSIYISIIAENQYTCLVYTDIDATGHIDSISKTLAISPLDQIGEDGNLGDVDTVYELVYGVGIGTIRCQKLKSRHMWFSFLDMP